MNDFIKNSIKFFLGFIILFLGIYFLVDHYVNLNNPKKATYIWGDSQAKRGLDMDILSKTTNNKFLSSATNGAGVYDFLIFTEKVPENTKVIVSISEPMMVRPIGSDRGKSGLSYSSLQCLINNNYPLSEVSKIVYRNIKWPQNIFYENKKLLPYRDSISYPPDKEAYLIHRYSNHLLFLRDKQNIIITGVKKLIQKNCDITFIEFPLHPKRKKLSDSSLFASNIHNFKHRILNLFEKGKIDTIKLDPALELMVDTDHMNSLGAKECSELLSEKMNQRKETILYIVQWRN